MPTVHLISDTVVALGLQMGLNEALPNMAERRWECTDCESATRQDTSITPIRIGGALIGVGSPAFVGCIVWQSKAGRA
jgi:hypothetical protein